MNALALAVQYLPIHLPPFLPPPAVLAPFSSPRSSEMQDLLFPDIWSYDAAWTTSTHVLLPFVEHVPLNDAALGVHGLTPRTAHPVVDAPAANVSAPSNASSLFSVASESPTTDSDVDRDANQAWEATYPAGSINPSGSIAGGFGFYLTGPPAFQAALQAGAREAAFAYSVLFEPGWEWQKGGKLPGACKSSWLLFLRRVLC